MSNRPTRFAELQYTTYCGIWRIVDAETGNTVGPVYKTKAELLADLERYAKEFGCTNAG
jgi:hypothetical protein